MNLAAERLHAVRAAMQAQNLEAFIVPRADEHLGEYVPPSAERLTWLTGFTGSAGLAVEITSIGSPWTPGATSLSTLKTIGTSSGMDQSANAIIAWGAREAYGTTPISGAGRTLSPEKRHEARSKMRRLFLSVAHRSQ